MLKQPPVSSSSSSSGVLLRLAECSPDSEYVLLLPGSMAGMLCDVLHRALACVQDNNGGCVASMLAAELPVMAQACPGLQRLCLHA